MSYILIISIASFNSQLKIVIDSDVASNDNSHLRLLHTRMGWLRQLSISFLFMTPLNIAFASSTYLLHKSQWMLFLLTAQEMPAQFLSLLSQMKKRPTGAKVRDSSYSSSVAVEPKQGQQGEPTAQKKANSSDHYAAETQTITADTCTDTSTSSYTNVGDMGNAQSETTTGSIPES